MEIHSSLNILRPGGRQALANALLQLKVGRIFPATVIKTLPDTGQAQLNIAGVLVKAQTPLPLTPGQILRLEVTESGALPKLKILDAQSSVDGTREKAILQNIASQKSPSVLSGQLLAISETSPGIDPLPDRIRNLAQHILTRLPDVHDLSTLEGVRRAIRDSGIFLEARLAALAQNETESLDYDLKAALLRLTNQTETENPNRDIKVHKDNGFTENLPRSESESSLGRTLLESAKGALSKIVMDQLASLPEAHPEKQVWSVEIPFRNAEQAESAKLTIERERSKNSDGREHLWSVVIELNPSNLGTVQSKINLSNKQVNAYFRVASESTRELIESNLNRLENQFDTAGLRVGRLAAGIGISDNPALKSAGLNLFDEHA